MIGPGVANASTVPPPRVVAQTDSKPQQLPGLLNATWVALPVSRTTSRLVASALGVNRSWAPEKVVAPTALSA